MNNNLFKSCHVVRLPQFLQNRFCTVQDRCISLCSLFGRCYALIIWMLLRELDKLNTDTGTECSPEG